MVGPTQFSSIAGNLSAAPRLRRIMVSAISAIAVAGCTEFTPSAPPARRALATATALGMTSCGATFRMISTVDDSLMDADGLAPTTDTVDVCETWTGSDYAYQATGAGSSDNIPGFIDTVQTTAYQSGYVTGYASDGSSASAASPVGSSAFDFVYADSATISASYDYPYYGISSPDPAACTTAPCPVKSVGTTARIIGTAASVSPGGAGIGQVNAHGLQRPGFRALVNDAQEISASRQGYRRFTATRGQDHVTWSIDPKTELLMEEWREGPTDTTTATYSWRPVNGGYVRDKSTFATDEIVNGKHVHSSVVIHFQKVRVVDPHYAQLHGPDVTP